MTFNHHYIIDITSSFVCCCYYQITTYHTHIHTNIINIVNQFKCLNMKMEKTCATGFGCEIYSLRQVLLNNFYFKMDKTTYTCI